MSPWCSIELESCDIWVEQKRTARKGHRCSSCGALIVAGERYTAHFSKYDDELCTGKLCRSCADDRGDFADAHDGMLPQPGYFPTLLAECIADGDDESETRWRPMLTRLRSRSAPPPPTGRPHDPLVRDVEGGR